LANINVGRMSRKRPIFPDQHGSIHISFGLALLSCCCCCGGSSSPFHAFLLLFIFFLSFFLSFLGRFTLNVCHGCSNQRQGCKDADPHRLILIDSAEWPDRWLSLSD